MKTEINKAASAEIIVTIHGDEFKFEATPGGLLSAAVFVAGQISNCAQSTAAYTTVALGTVLINLQNVIHLGSGEFLGSYGSPYSQMGAAKHYLSVAKKQARDASRAHVA